MPEPKIEKKVDGQDGTIQKELKLINDLKTKHADELRLVYDKNAEREKRLIAELENRIAEERKKLQEENTQKQKNLMDSLGSRHAQDIQILQAESEHREKILLNDFKAEHHTRSLALFQALLKAKYQRDKFYLAVSWFTIIILALMAVNGHFHEIIAKAFTFAALAGLVCGIISVRRNLSKNSQFQKLADEGTIPPDSVWQEDDGKPLRFLTFSLISFILLGLTLIMSSFQKVVDAPPTVPVPIQQQPAAPISQTSAPAPIPVVSPGTAAPSAIEKTSPPPEASSSVEPAGPDKTSGNGGNFAGGIFREK